MKGFAEFKNRYERFMEKQGFYWLCGFCALVILFTALWTQRQQAPLPQPPAMSVHQSQDETLAGVVAPRRIPDPTPAPLQFSPPLKGSLLRPFSASAPVYFEHTGHWQLHAGADYAAPLGEPVKAVSDGTVVMADDRQVILSHPQGYESRYLGLISAPYVQAGDPVQAGQTIGHVGQGPLWEKGDEPHLHLEILQDGRPLDPASLLK
ncbi:MAG: M23 family metallopeptidase [Clostridia bacterium]|nr:M23 family metallopeptidase [Clostridia bacterium]